MWRGIVDIPSSRLQVYWETLNKEEQHRAQRLRIAQNQSRFVAARGILRSLLGRYLGIFPREIEFGTGPHGKPFIKNSSTPELHFNISHSQRIALLAFSQEFEVGVDVEGPRPHLDHEAIAKRILNDQEQEWFQSLPASKRRSAFLSCWTRKEAFTKAHGAGLTFPLREVTVTFLPHQAPSVVSIENTCLSNQTWSMYSISSRPRYAGALVVAGQPDSILHWNYQ